MVNKDKIAIVTGSSAGLGASVAIQLAKRGINVVINYSKNDSPTYPPQSSAFSLVRKLRATEFRILRTYSQE